MIVDKAVANLRAHRVCESGDTSHGRVEHMSFIMLSVNHLIEIGQICLLAKYRDS